MKKLSNLKGAKALNKKEQKSIHGGRYGCYPFFHLGSCRLDCDCNTHTASQPGGASQYCLLNYPAIIFNASQCGGSGGSDVWA